MQIGIDLIHEELACEMSNNGTEYRLCSGRIESCSMKYVTWKMVQLITQLYGSTEVEITVGHQPFFRISYTNTDLMGDKFTVRFQWVIP